MEGTSHILADMSFVPLPDKWAPLGAACLVKCLDGDGNVAWSFRTTHDLNDEELLGALILRVELLKTALIDDYVDPEEGDDDD